LLISGEKVALSGQGGLTLDAERKNNIGYVQMLADSSTSEG